jgi:hypothetical protein
MDRPYSHADFVHLALAEFPSLREEFEDDPALLHLQMHAFERLVSQAKGEGDWVTYGRAMQLAHELWRRPDAELLNALNVSFLEHLDFNGSTGAEAWRHLSPELQDGWRVMNEHMKKVAQAGKAPRKTPPTRRPKKR